MQRTFQLGAGRATRTFSFRERGGVILRNQVTVWHGVRVFVDARSPDTAVLKIWSWARHNDPSLSCRRHGGFDICTQGEQWCPMPQATWHFRLFKLSGPAGPAAATLRSVRAMQLVSDSQARTALLVTDDCVGRHLQRRADDRPSHAGATPPPTSAGPPKGCLKCGSAFRPRC